MKLVVRPKAKLDLKRTDGGDTFSKVHAPRITPKRGHATPNKDIPRLGRSSHPLPMSLWPQHERLKAEVNAYCDREGVSRAEVAKRLNCSMSYLNNCSYGSKRPSARWMQKASKLFGCSVTVFLEDPAQNVEHKEMDETARWMAREMTGNLADMTPQQRQIAYDVWKATVQAFKK